jgi:hypothetical protein
VLLLSVFEDDHLTKLKAQIAERDVQFRVEGVDKSGKVLRWAELTAKPSSDGTWGITIKLGDGTSFSKSHPDEGIEDELTELMLWIRGAFLKDGKSN